MWVIGLVVLFLVVCAVVLHNNSEPLGAGDTGEGEDVGSTAPTQPPQKQQAK